MFSRFLLVSAALALSGSFSTQAQPAVTTDPRSAQVYFSPRGGCTEAIVKHLGEAKTSVFVQAYSFTSAPIAEALVKAHRRDVKVQAILDKSQRSERYSSATFLANTGVSVLIDDDHQIAHNKMIIIDSARGITGSFNFSKSAEERNAENLLVLEAPALASSYEKNWREHTTHSAPYEPRNR